MIFRRLLIALWSFTLIFEGLEHYFNGPYGQLQALRSGEELAVVQFNAEIISLAKHVASSREVSEIWIANDHQVVEIHVNPCIVGEYDK